MRYCIRTDKGSQFDHGRQKALPEPAAARSVGHAGEPIQELVDDQNDGHHTLVCRPSVSLTLTTAEASQRTISEQKPAEPHHECTENHVLGLKQPPEAWAAASVVLLPLRAPGKDPVVLDTGPDVVLLQFHHCVVEVFHRAAGVRLDRWLLLRVEDMGNRIHGRHGRCLPRAMLCQAEWRCVPRRCPGWSRVASLWFQGRSGCAEQEDWV